MSSEPSDDTTDASDDHNVTDDEAPGETGDPMVSRSESQTHRSASDILKEEENKDLLKYVVGIFGIVGAGFGLTGAFGVRLLADESTGRIGAAFLALSVFTVMFFSGPILGAITGLQIGERKRDIREALITSFASGVAGYIVMVVVGVLVAVLLFPNSSNGGTGGGSPFELGDIIVPLVVMAIPVGVVAAGMIYVGDRLLD